MTQQPGPVSQQPQILPPSAQQRIAQAQQGRPCFIANLSVNEFVLTGQAGFEPLGLVMGTSIYHVGIQYGRWSVSQELQTLSQAMYHARELAMARMESEADALGADGVIGVTIKACRYAFSNEILEFVATGTAVRATGDRAGELRTPAGRPFSSHLSGQDFWTLQQHGWVPRAMVMGTCVYHVAHLTLRQTLQAAGVNSELGPYTQAVYDAREIATARMQFEGQQVGADGIVGASVQEATWVWGEHAIEFFALGTAVARAAGDASPAAPQPTLPLTG